MCRKLCPSQGEACCKTVADRHVYQIKERDCVIHQKFLPWQPGPSWVSEGLTVHPGIGCFGERQSQQLRKNVRSLLGGVILAESPPSITIFFMKATRILAAMVRLKVLRTLKVNHRLEALRETLFREKKATCPQEEHILWFYVPHSHHPARGRPCL